MSHVGRTSGRHSISSAIALRLLLAILPAGSATVVQAAGFVVNSTGDSVDANPGNTVCADASGNCTLRAAIMEANALAGPDSVTFSVSGTISRATQLPAITQNLSITGPGVSVLSIDGSGKGSTLTINGGVTVSISTLTLTGGIGSGAGGTAGGGIDNSGMLTLTQTAIVANAAQFGGAIYNAPGAKLVVTNSTLAGNTASGGFGSAIYNVGGGTTVTITGCTISGNTTSSSGAINAPVATSVAVTNSTISGNIATGPGATAGIHGGPNVTVTSSTIFGNTGIGLFGCKLKNSIVDSCGSGGGIVVSQGNNLAPSSACFFSAAAGDVFSANFLLGPLQNNGGPTQTHALLAGSPALDGVPLASCTVSTDQRGVARPQGIACDMGAYELPPPPTPTRTPTSTRTPSPTATATPPCVQPPPGIVAWWPLNPSMPATLVDDIWTFNNDGAVGGPLGWTAGWVNGAFQFNGSSTYLDVPSSASLNFGSAAGTPPGDFSIDAWIMLPQNALTSGVRSLVDKRQGSGSLGYQFYLFNRQLGLQIADTGFTNYNSGFAVPADALWHHIAVAVDRTQNNGVQFYYDGAPVGVSGNALLRQGTLVNNSNLRIGAHLFGGQFLDASLDEVQIFNRALSPSEVRSIFEAQRSGKCTPTPTATATPTSTPTVTRTPSPSGHAEICIVKFHDVNGNGVHDTGEAALPGWHIDIKDLGGNVVTSATTGPTGGICFGVPAPSMYNVVEVLQAGWSQTFPSPPGIHMITVAAGQLLNLEFGNQRTPNTPTATATFAIPTPTASTTATRSPSATPTPAIGTPTATLTPSPTAMPCIPPPPDMVAWWSLDEQPGAATVADTAGFANNGIPQTGTGGATVIGTVPSATTGPIPVTSLPLALPSGMVGGALYFFNPYIEVADQAELDFGTGDLTIDAWVWPPAPFGNGNTISSIVDKLNPIQKTGYAFYISNTGGGPYDRLNFAIGNGITLSTSTSAVSLTYGIWNHVAVTVNRSLPNGVTFYIDGVVSGLGPQVAGNSDNAVPLWIGKSRLSPPAGFTEFAIDEIELFNRALAAAEIQSIFAAGSAGKCKPPCAGDCDGSARVSVAELVRGVNIALGTTPLATCAAFDLNSDGVMTIDELTSAVDRSLEGCFAATVRSPSGITLTLKDARPLLSASFPGGPEPARFTVEIAAQLTNDSPTDLYVLGAVAPERSDLSVEVSGLRKVCKHKFLWWGWDCFDYQHLRHDPRMPVRFPGSDTLVIVMPDEMPGPRLDAAPADLVVGVIATHDIARIAEALDVSPETIRLTAPPLKAGDSWPLIVRLPLWVDVPQQEATRFTIPLTIGVALADDEAPTETALSECGVNLDWLPGPNGLTLKTACGNWTYFSE